MIYQGIPSEMTSEIKAKIKKIKYKINDLGVIGVKMLLEKYKEL